MIHFNEPAGGPMELTFPGTHPELQALFQGFNEYSAAQAFPDPVLTEVGRDETGMVRIYVRFYRKLQQSLEGPHHGMIDPEDDGTFRPLTLKESDEAKEIRGLFEAELVHRAQARFSWHTVLCAYDLRTRHYSAAQLPLVVAWFQERCKRPDWEFLVHDVHGPHIHVGRRDFEWRTKFGTK